MHTFNSFSLSITNFIGLRRQATGTHVPFGKSCGDLTVTGLDIENKRHSLHSSSSFCDEMLSQIGAEVDANDGIEISWGSSVGKYMYIHI